MDKLKGITQVVQEELIAFEKAYKEILQNHNREFQSMLDFVTSKNGKRIRPLILLLSAKLCGEINPKTIDYAIILELLHSATLIHDDVVDNTLERRGSPSVNAKYDNRVAVLLGDYILSIAITRGVLAQNFDILNIISELAQNLAEGELTQLISSREIIIDEERYFNVIWKKTAVLLASCSEMGALSVNADAALREKVRLIGGNLGVCFQIKDDIFDYFEQGQIGKPTGNDIREGKITLPLIFALNNAPKEITREMVTLIEHRDFTPENIRRLTDFAKTYKGIEYAQSKMQAIKEETLTLLAEFPDSETKTAMIQLIDYIIEREK